MSQVRIPSAVALVVGVVMAIWGRTLPLNQKAMADQTTGEFILANGLTIGGVLIALMACFALGRSTRKAR